MLPVIIAIHPDELSHTSTEMVKGIIDRINKSRFAAVVHLDHGAFFRAGYHSYSGWIHICYDRCFQPAIRKEKRRDM